MCSQRLTKTRQSCAAEAYENLTANLFVYRLSVSENGDYLPIVAESALIVVNIPLGMSYTWCLNALLCTHYGNNTPLCSHLTLTQCDPFLAEGPHAGLPFYIELP